MDESVRITGRHRTEHGGPSVDDVIRRVTWSAPADADESFAGDLSDNRDMAVSS